MAHAIHSPSIESAKGLERLIDNVAAHKYKRNQGIENRKEFEQKPSYKN